MRHFCLREEHPPLYDTQKSDYLPWNYCWFLNGMEILTFVLRTKIFPQTFAFFCCICLLMDQLTAVLRAHFLLGNNLLTVRNCYQNSARVLLTRVSIHNKILPW